MIGLARRYLQRRYLEGYAAGFEEGYRETYLKPLQEGLIPMDAEEMAWNERRLEAERRGKKFKESPPGFEEALRKALAKKRCPSCHDLYHDH